MGRFSGGSRHSTRGQQFLMFLSAVSHVYFRCKDTKVYSQTGWGRAMAGCASLDPPLERFIDYIYVGLIKIMMMMMTTTTMTTTTTTTMTTTTMMTMTMMMMMTMTMTMTMTMMSN